MNRQKPKPVPSFAPLLEDDFLIAGHWKERRMNDEKEVKRKIKKAEKETMRELQKDTLAIQAEKRRISDQRRNKGRSQIYRGGNKPTDEV